MNPNDYTPTHTTPPSRRTFVSILAAAIVVIAIVIWIIVSQSNKAGKVAIEVHVLPTNATVLMNGKRAGISLAPGTYTVRATANGFADYTGTYSVSKSIDHPVLAITLDPVSAAAREYVDNNQALYSNQEGYGGRQAHQQSALIFKKSPITRSLPYSNLVYTIGYQSDSADPTGQNITVIIEAPIGYRNAAIQKIWDLGYNPADYTIVFSDYVNPFKP